MKRCHNIKLQGFGRSKDLDSWEKFLDIKTLLSVSRELLEEKDYGLINEYIDNHYSSIRLEKGVLVHGDFCIQHIFSYNKRFSGFIDFGDSFIGDPLIDLAYFKFKEINKDYGDTLFEIFSQYYFLPGEYTKTTQIKLHMYMIYWGLTRMIQNRNTILEQKFRNKLELVVKSL